MGKHGGLWGREERCLLNVTTRDARGDGKFGVLGVVVNTYTHNKIEELSIITFPYAQVSSPNLQRLIKKRNEYNPIRFHRNPRIDKLPQGNQMVIAHVVDKE